MKYVLLVICFALAKALIAQNPPPSPEVLKAFEPKVIQHQGKNLPYRILLPDNFDTTKKYPLHLFLHGSGERGDDNIAQLTHGGELFVEMNKEYPAVVIFPQCPTDDYWSNVSVDRQGEQNIFKFPTDPEPTWAMAAVIALLEEMMAQEFIDNDRIYLGGLSMGGMGTFELLHHKPETFAAATPICGGGNTATVENWAGNTPIWIFHGDDDSVVPAFYSKIIIESLLKNNVTPRVSLYPGVNHDSWTSAFAEPDFFSWIYSQKMDNSEVLIEEDCTPEWLKFSEATLLGKYKAENKFLSNTSNADRIVFMGDSITEGWSTTSPEFWENHPEFVNRGVSGQTTPQMLVRFRQDVIQLNPKTVVILAGTNDIAGNTGETTIQTIANNIFTMADLAKMHNIHVIIGTVLPVYDYPWKPGLQPAQKVVTLNKLIADYAQKEGHTIANFHQAMKNDENGMKKELTYDGVHCTEKGYDVMQEVLLNSLK